MSQTTLQKHISRLMSLLLCALMLLPCIPVVRADEGTCGSDLTWSFDGSTLTISGSGAMENYTEADPAPWYAYRDSIARISLPDGLSRIGSRAFADCTALMSVVIPGSVEIIADAAFLNCSSMTMATLNEGLLTIGVCAFEHCSSLGDIRLPNSLMHIDDHAFYLCESLAYVTIPGAVRRVGSGVFAYCSSLIRADINADVTMPGWSFYGCDNLQVVTIQGVSVAPESLKVTNPPQGIPGYVPSEEDNESYEPSAPTQPVTPAEPSAPPAEGSASSESTKTDASGATVTENTVVKKNEDSVVTTTNKTPVSGTTTTEINSTIQNENGWQDVLDGVNSALLNKSENPVEVTVMTPNSNSVSKEVLQEFAGKNVNLSIHTQSGTQIRLDCSRLPDEIKSDLELSYTIIAAEDVPESLAGCIVYKLSFDQSADIEMEIVMRLPADHSFQNASLYQLKKRNEVQLLQTVLVDGSNNAHWYIGAVDKKTDYLIGINVPGANVTDTIIPENLYDEYRLVDHSTGKEYVITGRKSSWNMGLGKVMAILAVVMVSAIGVVGAVMFFWNKQRLKNGYVPKWEDEEE